MNKQIDKITSAIKKAFSILLILDFIGLVLAGIALLPTFKGFAKYGQPMMGIAIAITAVFAAVLLFEILAKIFLLRSTSPTFSWSSGRKGYTTAAKLLLLFNLGAVLFNLLSAGGEGATLINQLRLYLQILASAAEIIAAFCYLRTVKKLFMSIKEDND